MKKILLLCGALLALSASAALAAGINLSYNDCGTFGTETRTFACNNNTGTNTTVASYVAPAGVNEFLSVESELEIQSDSATLPDWWKYKNAGTCRIAALTSSADFTAGPFNCADFWAGGATGSIASYIVGYNGPNRAYCKLVWAVGASARGPLTADVEYYAYKLSWNNSKSIGLGSCAGCLTGVCVNLRNIKLVQPSVLNDNRLLTNPANRAYVRWQTATDVACLGATPARNSTWGSVKALYR